jgi:hypothetical protein
VTGCICRWRFFATLVDASAVDAQWADSASRATVVHSRCRDAHPLPTCGGYLVFEFAGAKRMTWRLDSAGIAVRRKSAPAQASLDRFNVDALD